jgi:hypothetical protein
MSETFVVPTKTSTPRPCSKTADMRMLAQVERWMAVIREMKQEPTKN